MDLNEEQIREWAIEAGFGEAACCSAEAFLDEQKLVSEQSPLAERRQLRFVPQEDDPKIKSIFVLIWPYQQAGMVSGDAVFVDSYYEASNAAYHAARQLEARILQAGVYVRANIPYPAKRAAVRAGLGIIGKNGLLITEKYGTRVVILLMGTDLELEHHAPEENERIINCEQCGRCMTACPSGALDEEGMSHPERCLRNYMMEGTIVPREVRSKIGMRLIGCDVCQRVCPMQKHTHDEPSISSAYTLSEFMTEDAGMFSKAVSRLAQEIGRNTARPQRVRAQAALLAGNAGNADYLPVLKAWTASDFAAVREHACWAIEEIKRKESIGHI